MKDQKGFTGVEGLLVLVILAIIGFTGWYVWHSKQATDKTNNQAVSDSQGSGTTTPVVQTYKKTTTVPATWITFSNLAQKFSFAHPANWTVKEETATHAVDPKAVAEADLMPMSSVKNMTGADDGMTIQVSKRSLSQTLAYEETTTSTSANKKVVFHTTKLTFDGHDAIKYDFPVQHAALKTVYLVNANGYTYDIYLFAPHGDNSNEMSKNTLTAFESLKFN